MKTKENPEMPMVPKAYLKTVEHQRDQYKSERDSLIDDIAVLKANISRLEKRVSELVDENVRLQNNLYTEELNQDEADSIIKKLARENEKLRKVNSNGWKQKDKVINNLHYLYTTLTDHIRLKAENNPGVSRYIDLVNYIDRLERD